MSVILDDFIAELGEPKLTEKERRLLDFLETISPEDVESEFLASLDDEEWDLFNDWFPDNNPSESAERLVEAEFERRWQEGWELAFKDAQENGKTSALSLDQWLVEQGYATWKTKYRHLRPVARDDFVTYETGSDNKG